MANRESFGWRYEPQYDPNPRDPDAVPPEVRAYLRGENFVWEGTEHLPGFKDTCIKLLAGVLETGCRLVRILPFPLTSRRSILTQ